MNKTQLNAWDGIVGPPLFVAVFTLEGWLHPGYDPRLSRSMSSHSDRTVGFKSRILWFLACCCSALHVVSRLSFILAKPRRQAASQLLTIIAICYLLSGLFVMNPSSTAPGQATVHGVLRGDRADTTMNYRLRDAVLGSLTQGSFDSKGFADSGRQISPIEFASQLECVFCSSRFIYLSTADHEIGIKCSSAQLHFQPFALCAAST